MSNFPTFKQFVIYLWRPKTNGYTLLAWQVFSLPSWSTSCMLIDVLRRNAELEMNFFFVMMVSCKCLHCTNTSIVLTLICCYWMWAVQLSRWGTETVCQIVCCETRYMVLDETSCNFRERSALWCFHYCYFCWLCYYYYNNNNNKQSRIQQSLPLYLIQRHAMLLLIWLRL